MAQEQYKPTECKSSSNRRLLLVLGVGIVLGLIGLALIIAGAVRQVQNESCSDGAAEAKKQAHKHGRCDYSIEAKRVGLDSFLAEVKATYYRMNPNAIAYDRDTTPEIIGAKFRPYDAHPEAIKKRTDEARALYSKAKSIAGEADRDRLKPRELKALAQVQHFLQSTFGAPYDENYYAGDWMLGPNKFCWQPICSIGYDLSSHYTYKNYGFHPKSEQDVNAIFENLKAMRKSVTEYVKNMVYGVSAGYIRPVEDCQDGFYSIQRKFTKIYQLGPRGVLSEIFVSGMRDPRWLGNSTDDWQTHWLEKKGKSVQDSMDDALVNYVGMPIHKMLTYLEYNHSLYCVPSNISSGFATLPLPYIYLNGTSTGIKTTGVLPSGEKLSGKEAYKMILPYFTTNEMTPDEVYKLGETMLSKLYPEAVEIAKEYTDESDEDKAVEIFKKELADQKMFFNDMKIPDNESNKDAFAACTSLEKAKVHCPMRYKAMMEWFKEVNSILSFLFPKTTHMFHFTSKHQTTPNCPVELVANFNPGTGSQSYQSSGRSCSDAARYRLPFFLKDLGPKYNAVSVAAHEGRPGHHTQVQGFRELFGDSCGGVMGWLNGASYYTAFTEGWALYAENPLIAQETDAYKNNPLQRYGMLKWQIWRALRLMMDTGLHYKGMKRWEAIKLFAEKAWDTTDKAVKDVTRYQSDPGQATAYMIGQLEIWKIRNDTTSTLKEAGITLDEKDFHYHVLSQGSSPLSYLSAYMKKYAACVIQSDSDGCDDILDITSADQSDETTPRNVERPWQPHPFHEHHE